MTKKKKKVSQVKPRERYYYTDNRGERIGVTRDHILMAIKIKIELQKGSPSGRCNWSQHKKLMQIEGFHDSAVGENYRKFIGAYQEREGLLPTKEKYIDLLSEKKIDSMKELTGELFIAKRDAQNTHRELNKLRREIADGVLTLDELKKEIQLKDFREKYTKLELVTVDTLDILSGYEAILTPSDWHVGLKNEWVDLAEIKRRIQQYAIKATAFMHSWGIKTVYIANIGDVVNNVYMHKNTQAFNAEFGFSQQIVEATHAMVEFVLMMAENFKVVYLGTIEGNHGRMSQKGETLFNDSAEYIVHHQVKSVLELSKHDNIIIDDSGYKNSQILTNINGVETLFTHGHMEQKNNANKIQKHMSIYSRNIDLMIQGHFHSYTVSSENFHRKVVTSGALVGSDDYAKSLGYYTNAGQALTMVKENSIIPVEIQID